MKKVSIDHIRMRISGIWVLSLLLAMQCTQLYSSPVGTDFMTLHFPQEPISGTVVDTDGNPLIGVTIVNKRNPSEGVITDINGKFTINVSKGDVLVFSYVGMKTQEITIEGQSELLISLEIESREISELMVIAYGVAKKESFTGSASVVSNEKIESRPVSSFTAALAANSSGLLINTSGQPGDPEVVRIRGTGSFNASNAPIYVIDGVVVNMTDLSRLSSVDASPMATINPSDIASVTVLKDAAASALYGSRAANGVIIISTKQGQEGKTRYNLDVQYGVANGLYSKPMANKDQFTDLWITGELHRIMGIDAIFTGLSQTDYIKSTYENENTYDYYLERARQNFMTTYAINGEEYDFWGDGYDAYPETDWYDLVSRQGGTRKINLSASGGQNGLTFFASGEYFNQIGTIIGSDMSRYSGRVNVSSKTNKILWVGANLAMSYYNQNGPLNGNLYANPLRAAANIPPVVPAYVEGKPNLDLPGDILNNYNPLAIMDMNIYKAYTYRNMANVWLQLNLLEGMFLKTTLGYDNRPHTDIRWENATIGTGAGYDGRYQEIQTTRRTLTSSTILNYTRTIGEKHNLGGLIGWEVANTHTNYLGGVSTVYASNYTPILSAGTTPTEAIGWYNNDDMASALSRLTYNFDNRYYIEASYRADASSRFGPKSRWGNFYSASGSWRFGQENFVKNLGWLTDGKFRASYGINGTLPDVLYAYQPTYDLGHDYYNLSGAREISVANEYLSWEQSRNYNVGLEVKFFNGRIFASAEYYNRFVDGLLFDRQISRTTGFTSALVNMGSMKNQGFEYTLDIYPVRTSDFTWNIILNLSKNVNVITELENDDIGTTNIDKEGYSEGSLYLPEWAGVDSETGSPQWYHVDENNGEKTITTDYSEATRQIIGHREPLYYAGISTRVSY
ncbi:MAG: SusC/RagA family TonB-linked outer membrane protein [Bacteroidales bacterium]|nr:SusC/RagA family TonB-linked outer membrane protein [Bacteroidales bacterium]